MINATGINNCRGADDSGLPFLPPTDVEGAKRLLNPASPMSACHTVLYTLLGLATIPLSYLSPVVANFVILSALAMVWLMPVVVPIVGLLIHYCDGDDEPASSPAKPAAAKEGASKTEGEKEANPTAGVAAKAAEPKKDK